MTINMDTFRESGTSAEEMLEGAPWMERLKKDFPWLWTELDEFCANPREFVVVKTLWLVNDPWTGHYPNRADGLRLLWEIAKELEAENESKGQEP